MPPTSLTTQSTSHVPKAMRQKENPASFVLREIHDTPTREYTRQRNAEAWRNLLSVEDYVTREHVLGMSKIASEEPNRLAVFALSAVETPNQILCSCEILIRKAWRYRKSSSNEVSRTDVLSGCIGGVYTYEENRGRGLATIMIDKLVETMKSDAFLGPDGFIFLYSEVGDFYARNGFRSFHVDLLNLPLSYSGSKPDLGPGFELIKYNEFGSLFSIYNSHLDEEIIGKVGADGVDRITVNPTSDYVDWFHLRAKFFGVKLFDGSVKNYDFASETLDSLSRKFEATEPVYFGIKAVCPRTQKLKGFLVWQYEYNFDENTNQFENYVTLVKSFVDDREFDLEQVSLELIEAMKAYLEAEHGTPQMSNFRKIVIWESEISPVVKEILIGKYKCKHGLENSSRSAILYNNEADDKDLKSGKILWENNTKLSWF